MRKAVSKRITDKNSPHKGKQKLEAMADMLADAGVAGDMAAIKEAGDRLDGKPAQTIDATITDERMVVASAEPAKDAEEWQSKHGPH